MSVYQHESPWGILDPSLEQHAYFSKANEPTPFIPAIPSPPRIQDEQDINLENCLKELDEIQEELMAHRHTIYSEKLKVLQNELASIENETHKVIVKQDKKLEKKRDKELKAANDMYEFQLQSIDKQVQHEKALVLQDIEQKADFANRVVTSEGTRKRKHKSPTAVTDSEDESEGEEVEFHRIHLKKKMGRLQAISDRQKATKFKKYHDDDVPNQEELQHDITMMRQKCA